MPTPSPALKRLPRWRTMISPPVTAWPAKTLTPRRWALESRPLRLEPRPFLCAISVLLHGRLGCGRGLRGRSGLGRSGLGRGWLGGVGGGTRGGARADLGDLDPRQLLAVAGAAAVAALRLELEDPQLLAAQVPDDRRLHLDLGQRGGIEDRLVGAVEQRLERDRRALGLGQPLDEQRLPLLDAVLLASGFDDRVHVSSPGYPASGSSAACSASAERRRPPLRPRRRGRDSTSSPSSSAARGSASIGAATAAVRPTSSIRTISFWPTSG